MMMMTPQPSSGPTMSEPYAQDHRRHPHYNENMMHWLPIAHLKYRKHANLLANTNHLAP